MRVNLLNKDSFYDPKELDEFKKNLIKDLELNDIIKAACGFDSFLLDLFPKVLLEPLKTKEEILYRESIYKDLEANSDILKSLYEYLKEILSDMRVKYPYLLNDKSPYTVVSSSSSLIEFLVPRLISVRASISNLKDLKSEGMNLFKDENLKSLNQDNLNHMLEIAECLSNKKGLMALISLDGNMQFKDYDILKSTFVSKDYKKRWKKAEEIEYGYLSETISNEINMKNDSISLNVSYNLGMAVFHMISFLKDLYFEIGFYLCAYNLSLKIKSLNLPLTFPEISDSFNYDGIYDMAVAFKKNGEVVGNKHNTKANIWVITGANQGGKTTFLRSLGQSYLLMQAGLFVNASSLSLPIISGLYTHFDKEEDTKLESGKFDDELRRFDILLNKIDKDSLVILNESFQSTDEYDGSKIGFEIISALLDSNIKVILVTHMYDLAMLIKDKYKDAYFLRAEREESGERSFRIVENEPLRTSFARDLYDKIWNE